MIEPDAMADHDRVFAYTARAIGRNVDDYVIERSGSLEESVRYTVLELREETGDRECLHWKPEVLAGELFPSGLKERHLQTVVAQELSQLQAIAFAAAEHGLL